MRSRDQWGCQGFTLIELMIVIAIIGILAAIAIPNFLAFQLRAKSVEARTNLASMRTAEETYFGEFGTYVTAAVQPAANGGVSKQPWGLAPAAAHGFNAIGWAPEGEVYFNYGVNANPGMGGSLDDFVAEAQGDLDGDGVTQTWGYVKPPAAGVVATGPGPFGVCNVTGTWNSTAMTQSLIGVVAPCDDGMGQRIF